MNESNDVERLEITIDPEYAGWGLWEAMRELVQNYLDANANGIGEIYYDPERHLLQLTNRGVTMDRRSLILGRTDKRDDDGSRGQWGEGMKIAWATLLRLRRRVQVTTNSEIWTPQIDVSKAFNGAKVLSVTVHKLISALDSVTIEVEKIGPDEWAMIKSRVLPFHHGLGGTMKGDGGRVLLAEKFAGKLFAKGIYVCDLVGDWKWGYDLDSVELDRDRKVAAAMSMEPLICTLLKDLTEREVMSIESVIALLEGDSKEGELFSDWWNDRNRSPFHAKVATEFKVKHGDDAVPVCSSVDATNAENHGMSAIIVPKALCAVVERHEGDLTARIALQPPATVQDGPRSPLSAEEIHALDVAYGIISPDARWMARDELEVVAFKNPNKLGDFRDGRVRVARRLLATPGMLAVVIAHEIACADNREGTIAHRNEWSEIMAQAFDTLVQDGGAV